MAVILVIACSGDSDGGSENDGLKFRYCWLLLRAGHGLRGFNGNFNHYLSLSNTNRFEGEYYGTSGFNPCCNDEGPDGIFAFNREGDSLTKHGSFSKP